jgi:glyoxylase-like metal-dependent hydrolase (beta-lactamase superfamily II)
MSEMVKPQVRAFFDEPTNTVSYLVWGPETMQGAVIDPVLDYDPRSGTASVASASALMAAAAEEGVKIVRVLETHAHADHLSAAPYIKLKTGARVGIGEHIREVQKIFRPVFHALDVSGTGAEFDDLFKDGERFPLGELGSHTGVCVLSDRRRRIRRRHHVHAGLRHSAGRFSGWRCAGAVPLDSPHSEFAA